MSRRIFTVGVILMLTTSLYAQKLILKQQLLTQRVKQYEKAVFEINAAIDFTNPYDQRDVALDMILISPGGKLLTVPCYYVSGDKKQSTWMVRFTPQEAGEYKYEYQLKKKDQSSGKTARASFKADKGVRDGFLHTNNYWTLKFDSGKPFRGIGENVGWESRSFEDPKWTYQYLLPTLSSNGANFFRTWMCQWNLPVAWNKVEDTKRYENSSAYYNEGGIQKMDKLVALCDSLGLYFMLSLDAHGSLIPGSGWPLNSHNKINGGPAATPTEFFTNEESRAKYKNRLRYIVARWGYSPNIGAWEFFNEIDNAVYTSRDSLLIPHSVITSWHKEMSAYLKQIDPYQHIVTTSVSHRDIAGLNELSTLDLNQKHIYNKTHTIAGAIREYVDRYKKPYVIGEFGYDWNWDNVKPEVGPAFDFDYKRGLWYGMFSPTPILPMTWWWEFFDERNMTPYFKSVSQINRKMLDAGKGNYEDVKVSAGNVEAYGVKCGDVYFVYLLNSSNAPIKPSITISTKDGSGASFSIQTFDPMIRQYVSGGNATQKNDVVKVEEIILKGQQEMIILISPAKKTGSD